MTEAELIRRSKFLSLVLRHKPETIGLRLDESGWALTRGLLVKATASQTYLTMEELKAIVEQNDKKRFAFSPDFSKIRASQGHSIVVDLNLKPEVPPALLYHGTAEKNIASIRLKGIVKGARHHVHLSTEVSVAQSVGRRYGKPVVLPIAAGHMHKEGFVFYLTENGVWLTEAVPAEYISLST